MSREERFKAKTPKLKNKSQKYFICCCPEEHCNGDLMLCVDNNGLLTTREENICKEMFRVHSSQEGSSACSQEYYCR